MTPVNTLLLKDAIIDLLLSKHDSVKELQDDEAKLYTDYGKGMNAGLRLGKQAEISSLQLVLELIDKFNK